MVKIITLKLNYPVPADDGAGERGGVERRVREPFGEALCGIG